MITSGIEAVWIGGNDIAEAGQWVWTDGTPFAESDLGLAGHCLEVRLTSSEGEEQNSMSVANCDGKGVKRAFVAIKGR